MGSGGKAGKGSAGAAIGVAGGGGGHADGPGGVGGGGGANVSIPVALVSPMATGPIATLHTKVAKMTGGIKVAKPTAAGVVGFLKVAKPITKHLKSAFSGDPAYQQLAPEQKDKLLAVAKDAAKGYLGAVPKTELQKAAAAQGFQYPQLIGKNDPKGSALAFVLNPFYDGEAAQKAKDKIQSKALLHYDQLADEEKAKADADSAALAASVVSSDAVAPNDIDIEDTGNNIDPPATDVTSDQATPAITSPQVTLPKLIANIKTSFTDLLKSLAGLALTRKAVQDLPAWRGAEVVQSLVFHHEGSAGHLGGVHEKHIYRSPDGQRWLFKPDKKAGGAVAAAEEAAAEMTRRFGMPAVEVRRVTIEGRTGSIQPLALDGGSTVPLSSDPVHWTSEQRAAVMAQHVVDWLLGDHDGNHTNFIMVGNTPVRIDRGQAFKSFGRDQLTLDYEPNKPYGAPPHAATSLYRAAREGKVTVNPLLLAPIIQAVRSVSDDELRQLLRPVAETGVKSKKVEWYSYMAKRVTDQSGQSSPPAEAVAAVFLDAVVARKHSIQTDFEGLFSTVLGKPFQFPE